MSSSAPGSKGTSGGASNWGPGFLPTPARRHIVPRRSGTCTLSGGTQGVDDALQKDSLETLNRLNAKRLGVMETGDCRPDQRIRNGLSDAKGRTGGHGYQPGNPARCWSNMARSPARVPSPTPACFSRRLIERGVRFVQIFHESWDQHGDLKGGLTRNCQATDRPSAALVRDLKQRGLLDDTIIIWGGEFGRTPWSKAE